jgi:DNA primase
LCGEYGQKKYVFVVEGYMDRLRFVQCGITNVVALLGWKMSARQAEKLQSAGVTDIISALDNDECGNKGTLYLQSLRTFRVVRWCYKEGVKDPGEMSDDDFRVMYRKTMHKYKHESKK